MNPNQIETVVCLSIRPDFGWLCAIRRTQPPGGVVARHRDVQVKRHASSGEVHPLCHRLEIVDGFAGLNFHEPCELLTVCQHQIGKKRTRTDLDRNHTLVPDVDSRVKFSVVFSLKESNEPVMFELFPNRPHKDGRHRASR